MCSSIEARWITGRPTLTDATATTTAAATATAATIATAVAAGITDAAAGSGVYGSTDLAREISVVVDLFARVVTKVRRGRPARDVWRGGR